MKYSSGEFVKFLGKGAFGTVDLVKYTKTDGSLFQAAVKTSYTSDYESLNRESQILSELRGCRRIVQRYGNDLEEGFSTNGDKVYKLLLEYASEGSLSSFMDNYTDRTLPDSMIRDFTRMILEGLASIHSHGYVHCDLKSDNLLVFPCKDSSSSYELKISDFGISRVVGEIPNHWDIFFPFVGTPQYMSPESINDGVARKTLDLWSLGCLVLEMYTGEKPWKGFGIDDLTTVLFDSKAPDIPKSVPCDAREFIEACFARDLAKRGTASELLLHRFLCPEETIVVAVTDSNSAKETKSSMEIRKKTLNVSSFVNQRFKKAFNKRLRLKRTHLIPLDSNLVSIQ